MPALILTGLIFISSLLIPVTEHKKPEIQKPTQAHQEESETPTIKSEARAQETEAASPPPGVEARGVYVEDLNNHEELLGYGEEKQWSIASLTKLMTAIIYMEEIPDFNKIVTFKKSDMVEGSALHVPVGTKFRAKDLLHASLMGSANNATNALVRGTSLSREEFVEKMNIRAADMGLKKTKFVEPTGLSPENKSTPAEYAEVVAEAMRDKTLGAILRKTVYTVKPLNYQSFSIGNTNKLLNQDLGYSVLGGKTGFTYGSDYNFATTIKKGEKEIVVVVFGDKTFTGAFDTTKKLAQTALEQSGF